MRILSGLILILLAGGCAVVAPPEDYPILPMPEKTQVTPISATRVEGGFLFSDDAYRSTLSLVQGLILERDTLRETVETYNEWVSQRKGEENDGRDR